MILTPKFSLEQDDNFVYVTIKIPYIRVTSSEVVADGYDFYFYCKPYSLRLKFPREIEDNEEKCRAVYDPNLDNGTLKVHLPKKVISEFFPDLDLTTSLLNKFVRNSNGAKIEVKNKIEVISSTNESKDINDIDDIYVEESNSFINDQRLTVHHQKNNYGFNFRYNGILCNLSDELFDMLEIKNPDTLSFHERRVQRIASENQLFDPERYLSDFLDCENDPMYSDFLNFEPFWIKQWDEYKKLEKKFKSEEFNFVDLSTINNNLTNESHETNNSNLNSNSNDQVTLNKTVFGVNTIDATTPNQTFNITTVDSQKKQQQTNTIETTNLVAKLDKKTKLKITAFNTTVGFNEEDNKIMSNNLKNYEFLILNNTKDQENVLLILLDILFAYCYDVRFTQGDRGNIESCYNITRLSSAISWLDTYTSFNNSIGDVMKFSIRRSLIFPYLRNFKLSRKVLTDVTKILYLGKRTILKCLLSLYAIYEHTDTHYLINKLFIHDYCVWIQTIDDSIIQDFAEKYNNEKTKLEIYQSQTNKNNVYGKKCLGFFINELEEWVLNKIENSDVNNNNDDEDEKNFVNTNEENFNIPKHLTCEKYAELYMNDTDLSYLTCNIKNVCDETLDVKNDRKHIENNENNIGTVSVNKKQNFILKQFSMEDDVEMKYKKNKELLDNLLNTNDNNEKYDGENMKKPNKVVNIIEELEVLSI